ncbi:MAG: methyl-accepting chemotaxis protein [Hyphomicrobiales bacterium]|nr:methyl-accepting chemotaxis protein [Hyphomicrobiales bacterium]
MPNFKISTWGLISSICLAITTTFVITTSVITASGVNNIGDTWRQYETGPAKKIGYLQELNAAIGYGGMIHQFKNYVLRQDQKRIKKIQTKVQSANEALAAYLASGANTKEVEALKTIASTISNYSNAVLVAKKMTADGSDPRAIDKVIKISDGPALKAIATLIEELDVVRQKNTKSVYDAVDWLSGFVRLLALIIGTILIALLAFMIWFTSFRLGRPLRKMVDVMTCIAEGNLEKEIPSTDRKDEIGSMAAAVEVFQNNAVHTKQLEAEQEEQKQRDDTLQAKIREEDEARAAERELVGDAFGQAMKAIAAKDLSYRIKEDFPPSDQQLKDQYNYSIEELASTINNIETSSSQILSESKEIHSAADNLAKRTEQQAVAVEETAAALEETTTAMKTSTENAKEASTLVATTKGNAEKSGEIVKQAISAMSKIEKSADEIASIIGVIDDIAFQTNLLALNAGVEAARAGESGKGFAVVAQEVRELAQRSANAAKEITKLIATSSEDVKAGASLVNETGAELEVIVSSVKEINDYVVAIVAAASEQSIGLQEINQSVSNIDQGTQQNAAVAEQTTAASHTLSEEVIKIDEMLREFKTGKFAVNQGPEIASKQDNPQPSPARELNRKVASSFGGTEGNAALSNSDESWEEF